MIYLQLVLGFGLLVLGGDALVRGAVTLAQRMGISALLIGLTLVGFGTSTPELVTSLQAALDGRAGIAVGNIVGSNIANILLILGAAAVIAPIAVGRAGGFRNEAALTLATVLCGAVILYGALDRWLGAVLVAGLIAYLVFAYLGDRYAAPESGAESATWPRNPVAALALAAGGIAVTILGARLAVDAAVDLALVWGMSETVVGLTIVAVGTSLPELMTSVVAALRGQPAIAYGNVVGSNIYNILGILGVTALVQPIAVPAQIAQLDIWVMAAATAALIGAVVLMRQISRATGIAYLAAYAVYVGWLIFAA